MIKRDKISHIEKEIRKLFKNIVVEKRGSVLYFVYYPPVSSSPLPDFSLNLYPESGTFALNIYHWNGLVSERQLKLFLTMGLIARKHGLKEKD